MRKWLKAYRMRKFNYIGYVKVVTERYRSDPTENCYVNVGLYLSDSGERSYKQLGEISASDTYRSGLSDIILWSEGGPFPKGFIPKEDSIRVMLEKLIDESIVGRK